MLQSLAIEALKIGDVQFCPPIALPLLEAGKSGATLVPAIEDLVRHFGFHSFTCGVSMSLRPTEDSLIYVFTTIQKEWLSIYNQNAYIEVDPRVQWLLSTGLPIIWDQRTWRGKDRRVDEFLDAGLLFGIGSGVAVGFVDLRGHAVTVAFNSTEETINPDRKAQIERNLGEILWISHIFEEIFVAKAIEQKMKPSFAGQSLSARERECLALAAVGQTGGDIACKLGIAERTVQFHFDSIRTKLGASTRQEAVAKAVQAGIVCSPL